MKNYIVEPNYEKLMKLKEEIEKSDIGSLFVYRAQSIVQDYILPEYILRKIIENKDCRNDPTLLYYMSFQKYITKCFIIEELELLKSKYFADSPIIIDFLSNNQTLLDDDIIEIINELKDNKLISLAIKKLIQKREVLSYKLIDYFTSLDRKLTFDCLAGRPDLSTSIIIDFKDEFKSRVDLLLNNKNMDIDAYNLIEKHKEKLFELIAEIAEI